ncbi:MAG: aminodeoxychorismate/anthranilate synthase component II [Methanobacteriaceae archaeon]
MILIIDNYDSFTYNLYQLLGEFEKNIMVKRNDEIDVEDIKQINPDKIIISPGPGNPNNERDFGVCKKIIKELGMLIPIFGVCLGHQGIFTAFGGEIIHTHPVHGKQSQVFHESTEIFKDVETPLTATRYHSLVCDEKTTPDCIEIIAKTYEGMIMAIKHKEYPIYGLQFHPESVGTQEGKKIMKNFLELKA